MATDKQKRIKSYTEKIARKPYSNFEAKLLKRKQELLNNLQKTKRSSWESNFNKFYNKYNYPSLEKIDPQLAVYKIHGILPNSGIYQALKKFALTRYGASVVYEILSNPKKYKGFVLAVGKPTLKETGAGSTHIRFSPAFPLIRYPTSSQFIYAPATIYHEFGHTRVFTVTDDGTHDLEHEAGILRILENPMRLEAGFEPRYTYTTRDGVYETINVIKGTRQKGRLRIKKDDPTVLVNMNDANAFRT